MIRLTFLRGRCRQLHVANVGRLLSMLRNLVSSVYLLTLAPYSAEVNIGIAAACIPTLLPLYRRLRDKFIDVRRDPSSITARLFPHPDHQGQVNPTPPLRPPWRLRKAKNSFSNPHRPEWWHSNRGPFVRIEDIEMQPQMTSRPKFKQRDSFIKDARQ